jgi:hypothetical protein
VLHGKRRGLKREIPTTKGEHYGLNAEFTAARKALHAIFAVQNFQNNEGHAALVYN